MGKIVINEERCKGCQLCVRFCSKQLIVLSERYNSRGVHPVEYSENGECTGCSACAIMCPDVAIEVYK